MASRRVVVPTHLWHVQLHQKVAHERLCFAWITYTDRYDGRTSLLQIRAALQDIDVRSYAVWELLGERDVLIKAYLPTDSSGEDLRATSAKTLRGELRDFRCRQDRCSLDVEAGN